MRVRSTTILCDPSYLTGLKHVPQTINYRKSSTKQKTTRCECFKQYIQLLSLYILCSQIIQSPFGHDTLPTIHTPSNDSNDMSVNCLHILEQEICPSELCLINLSKTMNIFGKGPINLNRKFGQVNYV